MAAVVLVVVIVIVIVIVIIVAIVVIVSATTVAAVVAVVVAVAVAPVVVPVVVPEVVQRSVVAAGARTARRPNSGRGDDLRRRTGGRRGTGLVQHHRPFDGAHAGTSFSCEPLGAGPEPHLDPCPSLGTGPGLHLGRRDRAWTARVGDQLEAGDRTGDSGDPGQHGHAGGQDSSGSHVPSVMGGTS